jgi:hypothetical protein
VLGTVTVAGIVMNDSAGTVITALDGIVAITENETLSGTSLH